MPLVLPLGIGLALLMAWAGTYALHNTTNMWLRPTLRAMAAPHGWKKYLFRVTGLTLIARSLLYIERNVRAILSHYAAAAMPAVARWLNGVSTLVTHTYTELGGITGAVADALYVMRYHTMPRAIHKSVAPVRATAHAAAAGAATANARWKAERKARERSISLEHTKWILPLAIFARGIDRLLRHKVIPRTNANTHATTVTLPRSIGRVRVRVTRLEKLLGLGALTGLVIRVLTRRFPWLFCRNVNVFNRALCGMNPNELNGLLALLLGALVLTDIKTLTRLMQETESEAAEQVKNLLSAF